MDRCDATKEMWDEGVAWNEGDSHACESGSGLKMAANHPIYTVSWYDVVNWCDTLSQKEGVVPCHYKDAGLTTIYKGGQLRNHYVNWSADHYLFPTEAEWKKTGRGRPVSIRSRG